MRSVLQVSLAGPRLPVGDRRNVMRPSASRTVPSVRTRGAAAAYGECPHPWLREGELQPQDGPCVGARHAHDVDGAADDEPCTVTTTTTITRRASGASTSLLARRNRLRDWRWQYVVAVIIEHVKNVHSNHENHSLVFDGQNNLLVYCTFSPNPRSPFCGHRHRDTLRQPHSVARHRFVWDIEAAYDDE